MREDENIKNRESERTIDELGRIIIPIEYRRELGIQEKDKLSLKLDFKNSQIILALKLNSCIFCKKKESKNIFLKVYRDKKFVLTV